MEIRREVLAEFFADLAVFRRKRPFGHCERIREITNGNFFYNKIVVYYDFLLTLPPNVGVSLHRTWKWYY